MFQKKYCGGKGFLKPVIKRKTRCVSDDKLSLFVCRHLNKYDFMRTDYISNQGTEDVFKWRQSVWSSQLDQ